MDLQRSGLQKFTSGFELFQYKAQLSGQQRQEQGGLEGKLRFPCFKGEGWDFPSSPVAKTPGSHCKGSEFDPLLGN